MLIPIAYNNILGSIYYTVEILFGNTNMIYFSYGNASNFISLYMVYIVAIFMITIHLLNMLIAQMNCSYSLIFDDMLGYARLKRSWIIVETMEGCPTALWERFLKSCGFADCLEFDRGDVGIPGGMTTQEPANWHTVVEDNVKRFGGDAMPMAPWPSDKTDEDDNRLSRIEKLLQRVSQRFERIAGAASKNRKAAGTSSSGKQGSSEHSSEKDDE